MTKLRSLSSIMMLLLLAALGSLVFQMEARKSVDTGIPITPNDEFFITSIDFHDINPEDYRLVVTGEVNNPLTLTLDDIRAMPVTIEIARLSCIAYKYGAESQTGVANWTGVKLSYILDLAEINHETAVDIILRTPDLSKRGYSTSLTPEEAYWDDVILAYEMNGEPLPSLHGFPLRLVCPRFYGYKWIKWLAHINVTTIDHEGFWVKMGGYEDSPVIELPNYTAIYYYADQSLPPSSNEVDTSLSEAITSSSEVSANTSETTTSISEASGIPFMEYFIIMLVVTILFRRARKQRKKNY